MSKAIKLQPDNSVYLYKLGLVRIALDDNEGALDPLKKSVKDLKNKQNSTALAIAYHNLELYDKAEAMFRKIPDFAGNTPDEYYQVYGRTSYQLDNNEKSIELLLRYINLIDEDKVTARDYLDLSLAYKDADLPDSSAEFLKIAREIDAELVDNILNQ